MKILIPTVLLASLATAAPHGGLYRGPSGPLPGGSSSSGGVPSGGGPVDVTPMPKTGGGSSSSSSGSSGAPTSPVPGGATGTSAGRTPRGIQISEDLSKWQYWWEFNKDSYLLLRQALREQPVVAGSDEQFMGARRSTRGFLSAPPTDKDIDERIVPALLQALNTTNRDIVSSCLVGLAKIGRARKGVDLLKLFTPYLRSKDQEIRETAALAMGISQKAEAAPILIDLATDTQAGRALTGRGRVDARTRSFAMYGLGLLCYAHPEIRLRMATLRAASDVLRDSELVDRNVKVAAVNALGLFRTDETMSSAVQKLADDVVRVLLGFYEADRSRGQDVMRAHVPTAVARMLGRRDTDLAKKLKGHLIAELNPRRKSAGPIHCSVALALGQMARPPETRKSDAVVSTALRTYFERGENPQARYFSLIALAQIGGASNRAFLLGALKRGSKSLERPWVGIALGLLVHRHRATHGAADRVVADALLKAFENSKSPYARGAMAIGLGLCGHTDAAPRLLERLRTHEHQDEMSGYLCVGLALMNYEKAVDPIASVLDHSARRPQRMRMASVALGKLGDRKLTKRLLSMLAERDPSLAKMAAVASALSQIGDRQSIDPLCEMLADKSLPQISRAFAAVALGGIGDKESEPWNAKIGININYRAAVETLVQSGAGVLEIL